jgi:hypothetical protein
VQKTDSLSRAWDAKGPDGRPIRFSITEIREILSALLNPEFLEKYDATNKDFAVCALLVGKPGHAKSSIVRQVSESIGHEYHSWHVNCSPFEDIAGRQHATTQEIDGETYHVDEHRRAACVPGLLPPQNSKTGWMVLMHDEFCTMNRHVQNIMRMIISERRINELKMYDKVVHIAATNPDDAEHVTVNAVESAVLCRTIPFPVELQWKEFMHYHRKTGSLGDALYSFLLVYKQFFEHLDPRSWGLVTRVLCAARLPSDMILKHLQTAVDTSVAVAFDKFLRIGTNPDFYPILGEKILEANGAKQLGPLLARIEKWVKDGGTQEGDDTVAAAPLLGATVADLVWSIQRARPQGSELKRQANNIAEVVKCLGDGPWIDMADELVQVTMHGELLQEVVGNIVGTPVGDRLNEALMKHRDRQRQLAAVKKGLATP